MSRSWLPFAATCLAVVVTALPKAQGPANEFKPDTTFTGSSLTGWTTLGSADWQAQAGEIVGRPRAGGQGGWLVLDRSYQDVNFFTRFRCAPPCQAGVLFRLQKSAAGMTGIYVSLADLKTYRLTLDAEGRETARDALRPAPPFVRVALPPVPNPNPPPAGAGAPGGFSMVGAGRGGGPVTLPTPLPELIPPPPGIRQDDWNLLSVTMDANVIRPILNQSYDFIPGASDERDGYGPIALHAAGTVEVRFKDVSFKDLHMRPNPPEQISSRFRMQRVDEFYLSLGRRGRRFQQRRRARYRGGSALLSRPRVYHARREIDAAPAQSPSTSFARTMIDYAYDFTGDGWADVLAGESRPMHLYVNPKGREAPMGEISGAAANHQRARADARRRRRRQAGDHFRHRRRRRNARVRLARSGESNCPVADAHDLRARARARPRSRCGRHQRRRPSSTCCRRRDGGNSRPPARAPVCGRTTRTRSGDGAAPKAQAAPRWSSTT